MMSQKLTEFQREYEQMKGKTDSKNTDNDAIEKELKKLQEKYREAMTIVHSLQTSRDHLEASMRIA